VKPLAGRIALVAGATRGAGRGIARMLGEAGATVYCTGRSATGAPSDRKRPETIDETAAMVTAAGGEGIAIQVDHSVDKDVASLARRIARQHGTLDVFASVFTGPAASWKPFLSEPAAEGWQFVESWIRPRLATYSRLLPVMVKGGSGLVVELVEQDNIGYHGGFYFDLMEVLLKRLIFSLAYDLRSRNITAIAVAPGFMRTEAILEGYGVTESNWRDALDKDSARAMGWGGSESPCFVGRAVAALAADPRVARKSGGIYTARELSTEYGFTDIDGKKPDYAVLDAAFEQAKVTWLKDAVVDLPNEWKVVRDTVAS
jgi:NAD(P)-dependent dehydrogenase (short-subunit alcohol dehydrogenase family)